MIYLDTHVVVWLYVGDLSVFSPTAKRAINTAPILISPVVALELTYLYEIGRLKTPASVMLDYLSTRIGLTMCDLPFEQIIAAAVKQTWTRDPFDRIIVGQAAAQTCGLVTKDRNIRDHYAQTIW
jgi:PIN domain nuclease of toxin-antitoxin system